MRSLILLVSLIKVLAVDGQDLPGGVEDLNPAEQDHQYTGDLWILDTDNEDNQLREVGKGDNKGEQRKPFCKEKSICGFIGGSCVTNATQCSGRLVAKGCKGANCQCCVPDIFGLKMKKLETELQSKIQNLNQQLNSLNASVSTVDLKVNSMNASVSSVESNVNSVKASVSDIDTKVNAMKNSVSSVDTQVNSNKVVIASLDSKFKAANCAEGFFRVGTQCFKLYMDARLSWTAAKAKCQSVGLILAEPHDSIANLLREYMLDNYGSGPEAWLGAKGDGSKFVWEKRRTYLYHTNPLWDGTPSTSSMTSSYCLELDANLSEYNQDAGRNQPYDLTGCTANLWPLCEAV